MAEELAVEMHRIGLEYSLALRVPVDSKKPGSSWAEKHLVKSSMLEREKRVRERERTKVCCEWEWARGVAERDTSPVVTWIFRCLSGRESRLVAACHLQRQLWGNPFS